MYGSLVGQYALRHNATILPARTPIPATPHLHLTFAYAVSEHHINDVLLNHLVHDADRKYMTDEMSDYSSQDIRTWRSIVTLVVFVVTSE